MGWLSSSGQNVKACDRNCSRLVISDAEERLQGSFVRQTGSATLYCLHGCLMAFSVGPVFAPRPHLLRSVPGYNIARFDTPS